MILQYYKRRVKLKLNRESPLITDKRISHNFRVQRKRRRTRVKKCWVEIRDFSNNVVYEK